MPIEIRVPSLGESESEATLVAWHKNPGDPVLMDDVLAEIESDKITMEITAFHNGVLTSISKNDGDLVEPNEVIGFMEELEQQIEILTTPVVAFPPVVEPEPSPPPIVKTVATPSKLPQPPTKPQITNKSNIGKRQQRREPMSALRRSVARHLKTAQNTAAMLTTFNEINMQPVMDLRSRYRDQFKEKYGIGLGFMSFFVTASVRALQRFPNVNAIIDGDDVLHHDYMDISIAVSSDRGLIVPVLRDTQLMKFADIEHGIADLAYRARNGGLLPADMRGGTFTISNGGVFGSLLSTPILNAPQSAILGMHRIQKRAVVENDNIMIRPMMYVALSYDHRLIDGREAVYFLASIKETLEYPAGLLLDID
ncbi:MAG: dihydrolipoyllysine-residue succinyltransferase [Mariprofundales bacterium]